MANECRSVVAFFGCHSPKVKARQRPRKLLTTKFQKWRHFLGVGFPGVFHRTNRMCVPHDASWSPGKKEEANFSLTNSRCDAGVLVDVTDIWLTAKRRIYSGPGICSCLLLCVCVCVLAMMSHMLIKSVYLAKSQASDTWHQQQGKQQRMGDGWYGGSLGIRDLGGVESLLSDVMLIWLLPHHYVSTERLLGSALPAHNSPS